MEETMSKTKPEPTPTPSEAKGVLLTLICIAILATAGFFAYRKFRAEPKPETTFICSKCGHVVSIATRREVAVIGPRLVAVTNLYCAQDFPGYDLEMNDGVNTHRTLLHPPEVKDCTADGYFCVLYESRPVLVSTTATNGLIRPVADAAVTNAATVPGRYRWGNRVFISK